MLFELIRRHENQRDFEREAVDAAVDQLAAVLIKALGVVAEIDYQRVVVCENFINFAYDKIVVSHGV